MYRVTINFTSIYYQDKYGDRQSEDFARMALHLDPLIATIFDDMPGTQTVKTLQLR